MRLKWQKSARWLWVSGFVISLSLVAGCGTRDYGAPQEPKTLEKEVRDALEEQMGAQEREGVQPQMAPLPFGQRVEESEGYLWRGLDWGGVSEERVTQIQDWLSDHEETRNNFDALGLTILGGAALGVVMKVSGSWFFGGPVEGHESHWFWRKLDEAAKGTTQGLVRGSLFAGGCYLLLTGIDPLPYTGLLGQQYTALSSALVLGGMSAGAASVFTKKFLRRNLNDPNAHLSLSLPSNNVVGKGMHAIQQWTTSSVLGRGLRYQVVPGLVIVGVGSGVGVLVFDFLQTDSEESEIRDSRFE